MPKYSLSIREEELKNKVAEDWFPSYDTTQIIGNIDFCIAVPQDGQSLFERDSLLWAEAKAGRRDIYESFVQLILTIGKAKTFNKHLPPAFLGAFDTEKMAFIQYNKIMDVFDINDFNWNVTPSDHESKEFKLLYEKVKATLGAEVLLYNFETDEAELRKFIKENFVVGKAELSKIQINKNNFTHVYQKWLEEVRDSIDIDWNVAKAEGLIDADFYLADLLSENNISLKEKLFVLLKSDHYMFNICRKATGAIDFSMVMFSDNQIAHTKFWNRYIRPPKQEYWDYIVGRRDLLVPQDIRERKGSYFTPKRWVELSQQYIADELGENWQDEYYVWDCAAGTGNLLNGLTNKYNIWASTLDKQDVDVMHDLIKNGKLNLLEKHVFRFDFLNDDFNMLPEELKKIIDDPDKRKKLIIYINPPYAEAASKQTVVGHGENKINVAVKHLTYKKYLTDIGLAGRELFAQFFIRIYFEIPSCVLAEFSKLKILQAPNFRDFRNSFQAKLGKGFIVPAYTFDNVKGAFPIGFFVWHLSQKEVFSKTVAEVYDEKSQFIGNKVLLAEDSFKTINDWIISTRNRDVEIQIGYMSAKGNDFQNMNYNFIINRKEQLPHPRGTVITDKNLREISIYFAVRHCIEATWLNDRDQFLYPNDNWSTDLEFQSDCLAYTLFHGQNNIRSSEGTNHWIPFTEEEVNAQEKFESHFMTDFIKGKNRVTEQADLFSDGGISDQPDPMSFSSEAKAVFDAGRELWRYYHKQPNANPNAAFYDIRLYFQGTNNKGKMNSDSADGHYTEIITSLRTRMKTLARKIEPKVYEYGFLLK